MPVNEIINVGNGNLAVKFTPFRHMEYIPAFLFITKELFEGTWNDIVSLPRNPAELVLDKKNISIIESEIFLNFLMTSYAAMIWPLFCKEKDYEALSVYEPTRYLANCFPFWAYELTQMGILPNVQELLLLGNREYGYFPAMIVEEAIYRMMKTVDEKYKFSKIKEIADELPCFEDFNNSITFAKQDFFRKWYHTRTKHPMVSLDDYKKTYAQNHNGKQWDEIDYSQDLEETVISEIIVNDFKATLDKKDLEILEMRMDGYTLESIAEKLGYKNHSGVLKRIRKIGLAYQKFTGEDFGFENRKII